MAVGPGDNQSIDFTQMGEAIRQVRPVTLDAARLLKTRSTRLDLGELGVGASDRWRKREGRQQGVLCGRHWRPSIASRNGLRLAAFALDRLRHPADDLPTVPPNRLLARPRPMPSVFLARKGRAKSYQFRRWARKGQFAKFHHEFAVTNSQLGPKER
jgi:hypothetical protein